MQVHRELFIRGEPERLDAVGEDIRRSLTASWTEDTEAEGYLRNRAAADRGRVYCFANRKHPRCPDATLFLIGKDARTLYVSNIVPREQHELSHDEYNAIIEDFYSRFAEPAAERNGARAEMTEPKADLESWLPPQAAEKLRHFCDVANKWSGSNHPRDRELWYEFIVAAQEAETDLSASTLARWLLEEGGWDEETANDLANEYQFARGILAFAKGERVGA